MSHAAQLNLASALLRQVRAIAPSRTGSEFAVHLLAPIAVAQLANSGLCPPSILADRRIASAMQSWRQVSADSTAFAQATCAIARRCGTNDEDAQIIAIALAPQHEKLLSDPCMLGWIYQLLLRELTVDMRRGKEEIAPNQIAYATQWFTPGWVSQFLIEETMGDGRLQPSEEGASTILDPACGAGHILVYALRQLVEKPTSAKDSLVSKKEFRGSVLAGALRDCIFGLDIDPLMIELAAFALYLQARALTKSIAELPVPHLYVPSSTAGGADAIGSLWLAAKQPRDLQFYSPLTRRSVAIESIPSRFDAIAANPPYLSHRMMPDRISRFLKSDYPSSQYDLYAAFLSMGMRLLAPRGRMAMICQQSFLSIQRYQQLRAEMLDQCRIEAVAQLGPGSFAAKAGEKVNNAIVVLSKKDGATESATTIRCWRLLDRAEKIRAEQVGLKNMPCLSVDSSDVRFMFDAVEKAPIALWCPNEINSLFRDCDPMQLESHGIVCTNGLFTCDNRRFVKTFLEVADQELAHYVPYDKGGGQKWYRTTPYLLHWQNNGEQIRHFRKSRGQAFALPGEEFYFRSGVTYSYIGTRGFKARLLSPNSIFDIASSAVFSEKLDDLYIVGFLNSALVCFLLSVLNPTINFQIGDLRRLPFIVPSRPIADAVAQLSQEAIALARRVETFDPDSPQFSQHVMQGKPESERESHYRDYETLMAAVNEQEACIQEKIDALIFALYGITEQTRQTILADPWVIRSHQSLCKPFTRRQCLEHTTRQRPMPVPAARAAGE